jgi:hypothetical protein
MAKVLEEVEGFLTERLIEAKENSSDVVGIAMVYGGVRGMSFCDGRLRRYGRDNRPDKSRSRGTSRFASLRFGLFGGNGCFVSGNG